MKPNIKTNLDTSRVISLKELNTLLEKSKKDARVQLIQSTMRKDRL
jgi:hypothetical protein